ncbi:hypothetical protein M5362_15095 [Streptomyces sp. Je 1-79]|uniref:hypothetical protein n=1 Tax=Streptomyces sp. Je 1-79 TaxID=2943847 RepID=UPI0021A71F7B|nr:hypothetical protein [Streptomyces sp. Je 1-79]MCT4354457.1 hypothetical protein [Streptomyces sp. Je 1-79]
MTLRGGTAGTGRRRQAGLWAAAVLLSAAALAGCGDQGTPPPVATQEGTAKPTPAGTGGVSVPPVPTGADGTVKNGHEPGPREVLVEVNVSGGLAGVRNQLIVRYDGSYTTRSGTKPPRTGRMTAAEVAELRAALEDPAYAKVPTRPTGKPVQDGFQYVFTHRYRVVVAADGERPPALRRVFEALPEGGPPTDPR